MGTQKTEREHDRIARHHTCHRSSGLHQRRDVDAFEHVAYYAREIEYTRRMTIEVRQLQNTKENGHSTIGLG
jgi:hypothetical protein